MLLFCGGTNGSAAAKAAWLRFHAVRFGSEFELRVGADQRELKRHEAAHSSATNGTLSPLKVNYSQAGRNDKAKRGALESSTFQHFCLGHFPCHSRFPALLFYLPEKGGLRSIAI
jgi:hypothetical protein